MIGEHVVETKRKIVRVPQMVRLDGDLHKILKKRSDEKRDVNRRHSLNMEINEVLWKGLGMEPKSTDDAWLKRVLNAIRAVRRTKPTIFAYIEDILGDAEVLSLEDRHARETE